jgi:multimeric flavodoxin WrbA
MDWSNYKSLKQDKKQLVFAPSSLILTNYFLPLNEALCNMESLVSTAIVLGTSRVNGNTHNLVKLYQEYKSADVFCLMDYSISIYDYDHKNTEDDFIALARKLIEYDHLIFATPMYWYSMSGQMKIFFDRLSDLLTIEKELGRGLRGKTCSVLATGVDIEPPACFEQPFILSANYLGMDYQKMLYCSCDDNFIEQEHSDKLFKYTGVNVT